MDRRGKQITLQETPERVVAMGPSVSQTVAALGARKRLVGRSRFCKYPPDLMSVPELGGIADPSLELIFGAAPDLVVGLEFMPEAAARTLQAADIPVALFDFSSLEQTLRSINGIGSLLGPESAEAAEKLTREIESGITQRGQQIREKPGEKKLRVLLMIGTDGIYSAGKQSYLGEILRKLGTNNLADQASSPWPELAKESVLQFDPEAIVILAAHDALEKESRAVSTWPQDPFWSQLSATKSGRVTVVDNATLIIPGPRLKEGVHVLCTALYPDMLAREAAELTSNGTLRTLLRE